MTLHFLPKITVVASFPLVSAEKPTAYLSGGKKDIRSESCPTCFPGKKWSELVHSSVDMHCVSGHRAASEDKTTSTFCQRSLELRAIWDETQLCASAQNPPNAEESSFGHEHHARERKTRAHAQSASYF